jgi:neutral amino acid transport system substrate-binding protein
VLAVCAALTATSCGTSEESEAPNAIVVAAVLPFTGEESTIGQNIEQALLLAVEDVNRAGGVAGRTLRLESRDSNSGSARGLDSLLDVLYNKEAQYLVGPEENELANEIVADIKGLDVLNLLPGYASPSIERVGSRGAWLRLPPSPLAFGCGLAELAIERGAKTANTLVAQDDFNQNVASEFGTEFFDVGGQVLTSATVRAGAQSYRSRTEAALSAGADKTLLIVNPTTAATILTEWAVSMHDGSWLFGPMLHTPGFLENVPTNALDGTYVLSPTLSLASECETQAQAYHGPMQCKHDNANAFRDYFAERWDGDAPFPAAHFYYDAVILLAMGLQYSAAQGSLTPTAAELRATILEMADSDHGRGRWDDLGHVMETLAEGTPLAYTGAAAEYEFDRYGAAFHALFDSWRVEKQGFVDEGTLQAMCQRPPT